MKKKIERLLRRIWFLFHEQKWRGRLKYVFENNHADTLMVVFSGFADKPSYNYMRTLAKFKSMDKLFILDDFGFRGSYYWLENGSDTPRVLVESLISSVLDRGKYKQFYTMGTSKGGTCAIYFGLILKAQHIYAGACQYYVGDYLDHEDRKTILSAMLGKTDYTQEDVAQVNRIVPSVIESNKNSCSTIHLLYSDKEHTYDEHIKFLLADLERNNIAFTQQVESFTNHADVGTYFIPFIQEQLIGRQ